MPVRHTYGSIGRENVLFWRRTPTWNQFQQRPHSATVILRLFWLVFCGRSEKWPSLNIKNFEIHWKTCLKMSIAKLSDRSKRYPSHFPCLSTVSITIVNECRRHICAWPHALIKNMPIVRTSSAAFRAVRLH